MKQKLDIAVFIKWKQKMEVTRLKSRKIYYRNYKIFDKSSFIEDLKSTNLDFSPNDPMKIIF